MNSSGQQGARGGDDQNGDRSDRGSAGQPRHHEGQGKEPRRIAVGQPHDRCALGTGLLGQSDDSGVGAVLLSGDGAEFEGAPGVDRTAAYPFVPAPCDLEGSPVSTRLVEDGGGAFHPAVDGYDSPRANDEQVTDGNFSQRYGGHTGVRASVCGARGVFEQVTEVVGGAPSGGGFHGAVGGEHERDQRADQVFTCGQGAAKREYGDEVNTGLSSSQCGQHPSDRGDDGSHGAQLPEHVGETAGTGEPGDAASRQDCRSAGQENQFELQNRDCGVQKTWSCCCVPS